MPLWAFVGFKSLSSVKGAKTAHYNDNKNAGCKEKKGYQMDGEVEWIWTALDWDWAEFQHRATGSALGWGEKLLTFQWTHFYSHTTPNSLLMMRALRQCELGYGGGGLTALSAVSAAIRRLQQPRPTVSTQTRLVKGLELSAKTQQAEDSVNTNLKKVSYILLFTYVHVWRHIRFDSSVGWCRPRTVSSPQGVKAREQKSPWELDLKHGD